MVLQRPIGGSLKENMEPVIVTITGYKGLERINLIKLINKTGAAYTGQWTPRRTHLVCWKFTGPKFEMAKRSGTTIFVNHRWFEECLSANKKLPEHPFTLLSGEEVGPLLWVDMGEEASTPNPRECLQHTDADPKAKQVIEISEEATRYSRPLFNIHDTLNQPLEHRHDAGPGNDVQVEVTATRNVGMNNASPSHKGLLQLDVGGVLDTPAEEEHFVLRKRRRAPGTADQRKNFRRLVRKTNADHEPARVEVNPSMDVCTPPQAISGFETLEPALQQAENYPLLGSPRYGMAPFRITDGVSPPWSASGTSVLHPSDSASLPSAASGAILISGLPGSGFLVACVICSSEKISEEEGILDCDHKFCFHCIYTWALESNLKKTLCPLCKAPFHKIIKRREQSRLWDSTDEEIYFSEPPKDLGGPTAIVSKPRVSAPVPTHGLHHCISCYRTYSQDLFLTCAGCSSRAIHVYCIEPERPMLENWWCPPCSLSWHR